MEDTPGNEEGVASEPTTPPPSPPAAPAAPAAPTAPGPPLESGTHASGQSGQGPGESGAAESAQDTEPEMATKFPSMSSVELMSTSSSEELDQQEDVAALPPSHVLPDSEVTATHKQQWKPRAFRRVNSAELETVRLQESAARRKLLSMEREFRHLLLRIDYKAHSMVQEGRNPAVNADLPLYTQDEIDTDPLFNAFRVWLTMKGTPPYPTEEISAIIHTWENLWIALELYKCKNRALLGTLRIIHCLRHFALMLEGPVHEYSPCLVGLDCYNITRYPMLAPDWPHWQSEDIKTKKSEEWD